MFKSRPPHTNKMARKNLQLGKLIDDLNRLGTKEKVSCWKRIASDLNKPTRRMAKVNLYKIEKVAKDSETVVVPGKVLANGELNKKVTVAAYQFSEVAKEKIQKKAKWVSIREVMKSNPKGKKVRIMR